MQFFTRRNLTIGVATFAVGIFAVASLLGLTSFAQTQTTVTGKVAAFLLGGAGEVDGFVLENGEQVHFSSETGAAILPAVKIGDEVSVTGKAGTQTDFGRAFKAEQITANNQTYTEIKQPKKPKGKKPHDKSRKLKGDDKPQPPNAEKPVAPELMPGSAEMPPKPIGEALNAAGAIKTFLVNMKGEIDGLILANGEQIRFSPKVGQQITAAKIGADAQVSVAGTGFKTERGAIIKAERLTIGNQTFTMSK